MEKLRGLWRNEYFKTVISILVLIALFLIFWYGSILYFKNETPYLVVSSESMRPTLEIGDLIIVKYVHPSELNYGLLDGDIIVFKSPSNSKELIVHRLKEITFKDGEYYFVTHGDANPPSSKEKFTEKNYVGKVIARVPFIGHVSLFTHTQEGFYLFAFVIICLIVVFMLFPSETEKQNEEKRKKREEKGILGKVLNFNFIRFLVLNTLILGLLIFSLWGTFSFWQPGADSSNKWVTIRGMYPDLEYHKNFTKSYLPKVEEVFLYQGLFTYRIDCKMDNGGIRVGVPTFSWAQFSILILVLVNVWMITKFLLSKKASAMEQSNET